MPIPLAQHRSKDATRESSIHASIAAPITRGHLVRVWAKLLDESYRYYLSPMTIEE